MPVICTLFESHYHYGLGAFINSLYASGFTGDIYAGYKGELPEWTRSLTQFNTSSVDVKKTFVIKEVIQLHFIPLKTNYHLANYKPNFMQWIFETSDSEADSVFYFDPDIIVNYKWSFYEEWVSYGITLCEDVNSPLPLNHPRRMAWNKYFKNNDVKLIFNQVVYANSGFVGVSKKNKDFLAKWIMVQEKIAPLINGLDHSPFEGKGFLSEEHRGNYSPFNRTDQDALNIAVGTWDGIVSFVGKEGMALQPGPNLMLHALGSPKPWRSNYLKLMFKGRKPAVADKGYWDSTSFPVAMFSSIYIRKKRAAIKFASFIGRFYSK
jgi:hypothetical protein